jgi:hypothetical protein
VKSFTFIFLDLSCPPAWGFSAAGDRISARHFNYMLTLWQSSSKSMDAQAVVTLSIASSMEAFSRQVAITFHNATGSIDVPLFRRILALPTVLFALQALLCSLIKALLILPCSSGRFRGGGKNNGTKSPGGQNGASPTSPTGTSQITSQITSQSSSQGTSQGSSQGTSQGNPQQSSSPSTGLAPRVPPLPSSPSLASSLSMNDSTSSLPSGDPLSVYNLHRPLPLWLNNTYAQHIVKGNFMTLSARPKTVEQGEWIAHQGITPPMILVVSPC